MIQEALVKEKSANIGKNSNYGASVREIRTREEICVKERKSQLHYCTKKQKIFVHKHEKLGKGEWMN